MLTIPEYFSKYIDASIDLEKTPKICCPFHDEDTPSFSYSADRGVWRCFGACKTGGDVYDLHRKNKHFKTKEEAIKDLNRREGDGSETIDTTNVTTFRMTEMDKKLSVLATKLKIELSKGNIEEAVNVIQEASMYKL